MINLLQENKEMKSLRTNSICISHEQHPKPKIAKELFFCQRREEMILVENSKEKN